MDISWLNSVLIALAVLAIGFLFPRIGLLSRIRKSRRTTRRILREDVLKHLADSQHKRLTASIKSIAGAIGHSVNKVAGLVGSLQRDNLVEKRGEQVTLTGEGESYAMRIVRTHRLWERYLADETSVKETEWHAEAEKKEHFLTEEEANVLAAKLGFPHFDPHGDPIPTGSGSVQDVTGIQLPDLPAGASARIIHVEDEPPSVFARLVEHGIKAGLRVTVKSSSPHEVVLAIGNRTIALSQVEASAIEVVRDIIPEERTVTTLADIPVGAECIVTEIDDQCRGQQRRRLMDLGVLPGTRITVQMSSPLDDPVAYQIRGATIALRRQQARHIHVARKENS